MHGLAPYIIGALAAVLLSDYLTGPATPFPHAPLADRLYKRDRLSVPKPGGHTPIAVVEVVGLQDTAIVYRDRDGHELFRTDPLSNVTVVAKDVVLPELTVKQSEHAAVVPVQPADPASRRRSLECDPAALPPSARVPAASRCVKATVGVSQFAAR